MLQQKQAQQDADYQRQRQDKRDDFTFEQDYRTAHPTPYRWESNDGSLMEMGPDGQARVIYKDPTPKLNWIQVRDPATGGLSIVPVGPNGPVGGQPQLGAPAAPGVTFTPLDEGGQTGTPSGGFPY
jgi:hypothetical protein